MAPRSSTVRIFTALLAGLVPAGVAPVAAWATPERPKPPRTTFVKLQFDVAGYVEARQLHDTKSDCYPGVSYIQTNRFEFETGRWVYSMMTNASLPGTDGVITTAGSLPSGTASVVGTISDFSTSNFCPPREPDPEPTPPVCGMTNGKISVGLMGGSTGTNGDLTTLAGTSLLLTVTRVGGTVDPNTCLGEAAGSLTGADAEQSGVTTSYAPGVSETLTTGLGSIQVFNLKKGKTLRRTIVIDGPCDVVNVRAGTNPAAEPNPGGLNADADCWMTGKGRHVRPSRELNRRHPAHGLRSRRPGVQGVTVPTQPSAVSLGTVPW